MLVPARLGLRRTGRTPAAPNVSQALAGSGQPEPMHPSRSAAAVKSLDNAAPATRYDRRQTASPQLSPD